MPTFTTQNDFGVVEAFPRVSLTGLETGGIYTETVEIAGALWRVQNATYLGGIWTQINVLLASAAFVMTAGGGIATYSAPAGSGTGFAWTQRFAVDTTGAITAGGALGPGAALANIGLLGVTNPYLAAGAAIANIGAGGLTSAALARADQLTQIGWYSVKDFGAVGDGVTNDTTAIGNAIASAGVKNAGLWFPPGTYLVGALTLNIPTMFAAGAQLNVLTATTVAITAPINATFSQIFSLAGTGVVTITKNPVVYAEWWGAKGDGATNDAPAINAALLSLIRGGTLRLLPAQYKITALVSITHHSTTLEGTSIGPSPYDFGGGVVAGTQIIGTNGVDGILVGAFGYTILRNFGIALPVGATLACVGIRVESSFATRIQDLRVTNYGTAIRYRINTDCYTKNCYLASTNGTLALMVGVDVDGTTTQNASIYFRDIIAAHSSFTNQAYAYWVHGNQINDTYFDGCEADSSSYGWYIDGNGVTAGYEGDIHIRGCSADSCVTAGFYVANFTAGEPLEISNGWSSGAAYGVFIDSGCLNVRVHGMQIEGPTGIYTKGSGAMITDNQIFFVTGNAIVIDNSKSCIVSGNMGTQKVATPGANFINILNTSLRNTIVGNSIRGVAGGFGNGIVVVATTGDYCSFIGNNIDSGVATTPFTLNLATNTHSYQAGVVR